MNKINTNIAANLTSLEKEVFKNLLQVVNNRAPNTTLRVAGGWVRDKLLGQPADDIDIMVDNMSGADFANLLVEELNLEKSPHVIGENPEKTKNIESAKMHIPINGQEVELDFTQARTEVYGENRREVTTRPASAEEDAMRRDLTIGAIFYNINEQKVEDFTGKGLKDLISGTIRTPYDTGGSDESSVQAAKKSFIEDPLRVFRAIRFASKYGGQISPATLAAIQDPEVINATFFSERKIATERIGQEFKKMLKGPDPALAIKLLKETGLMQHILNESLKGTEYEGEMEHLDMEQNNPHHEMSVWEHTYTVLTNLLNEFPNEYKDEKKVIMVLAALTHDLGKLYRKVHGESKTHPGRTSYHGHEDESKFISEHILRFLKFESDVIKQVSALAQHHMYPHKIERADSTDKSLRRFVRKVGEDGLHWMDVLNLAIADAYSKSKEIDDEVVARYSNLKQRLEQAVQGLNVSTDQANKPSILNGNEIMQVLKIRPGNHMKEVIEFLKDVVDENPNLSKEEASEMIRDKFSHLSENEQLRTAKINMKLSCSCPKHLFNQRENEIKQCIKEGNHLQGIKKSRELLKDYPDDKEVVLLSAMALYRGVIEDRKLSDNQVLSLILHEGASLFEKPLIGAYATGILLATDGDPELTLKMGAKSAKLAPSGLLHVLDILPEDKRNDIYKELLNAIQK